ncbi:hypothetical protein OUZ56_032080 [Daphnia magna]|uniref:Uncharacterized protein n=1 Tax=Daphnia magna TaxID=35525 RepID=A0ABQ9ZW57_9CRUS|nr:hypothetical protein OUZ56_032080 [Daphnia magna]
MAEHVAQDFNSLRAVSHVPKFDSTNHREWNYEIHLCFQAMEVDCVVLGTELCPAESSKTLISKGISHFASYWLESLPLKTQFHQP